MRTNLHKYANNFSIVNEWRPLHGPGCIRWPRISIGLHRPTHSIPVIEPKSSATTTLRSTSKTNSTSTPVSLKFAPETTAIPTAAPGCAVIGLEPVQFSHSIDIPKGDNIIYIDIPIADSSGGSWGVFPTKSGSDPNSLLATWVIEDHEEFPITQGLGQSGNTIPNITGTTPSGIGNFFPKYICSTRS